MGETCSTQRYYISVVCKILVGKPEGRTLPVRPKCRWEDTSLKFILKIYYVRIEWVELA